jgi:hypothetical protein
MIDPVLSSNVPEIGKKVDSIPVTDVMTAMAQLEQELKEFFLLEAATMQDRIDGVYEIVKEWMSTESNELISAANDIIKVLGGEQE